MNILSINLASHEGHIAVCSDTSMLAWSDCDHRLSDADLIPLLEKTLENAGIGYSDLTHLACVIGPGGFTSIRSGVTLANVLGHELKIPVAGVHLSDLYQARSSETTWWLHSTKKEHLFVRGVSITEPTLMDIKDLLTLIKAGDLWMGELIESQESLIQNHGLTRAEIDPLQDVLPAFLAKQTYGTDLLEPWYGRGW